MKVWILTLIIHCFMTGTGHHYDDSSVFASKESCERILRDMKADYGDSIECREIEVQK